MHGRLNSLTGMRAIAAAVVFVHHLPVPVGAEQDLWERLTLQGPGGVTFFFALSGFVLMWALRPGDTAGRFYQRRFARIYPALFVVLVAGLFVNAYVGVSQDARHAFPAFLALQAWIPNEDYYFAVNPATWSLSAEAFFYLTFPLYAARLRLLSGRSVAVLGLALVTFVIAIETLYIFEPTPFVSWLLVQAPFVRVLAFILGALVAVTVLEGRWPRLPWQPIAALGVGVYVLDGFHSGVAASIITQPLVPSLLLIGALASIDARGGSTVFGSRGMVWLGEVSYSFYLVHIPVIALLAHHLERPVVILTALPVALAVAALLHYSVERPFERRIRGGNSVAVAGTTAPAAARG
ncbi:MAG TPA: acyltransferase [Thermoleophilaceae bacterium]|nr:acyltransferase [Thermoleophilaceae bacterium]